MMMRYLIRSAILLTLVAGACAAPKARPADSVPVDAREPAGGATTPPPPGITGDQAWDKSVIDQLERDARKLAKADGCRGVAACRTAPVGVKACGGPRDYIVYCATATDSVALFRKLDDLARLERAYNQRYGIMSTCELRTAPEVALVGQTCRAVP